jgi:kynureninase
MLAGAAEKLPFPLSYQSDEVFAQHLDASDSLAHWREQFLIPRRGNGLPVTYFCGHSLGLQPRRVRSVMEQELAAWEQRGVAGHFQGENPWYSYHELFRDAGVRLVGAEPGEVVMMNSLTVNLHLLMTTFYRPASGRIKILTDGPVFPSDLYALQSQIRYHGLDPRATLIIAEPRAGENSIRPGDIGEILETQGEQIALVWLNGVNFFTGQLFDVPRLTAAAKQQGCVVGLDLAHAAGNVILHLHDWQVDFAVWCNYKYLNGGPGAIGGCFVHEKHGQNPNLPRLAGWWGNDPATRFQIRRQSEFVAQTGAAGWQVSNPPIFAMVPLRASLAIFDEVGMPALRAKSVQLSGYLEYLVHRLPPGRFQIITPSDPEQRGCQLSIRVNDRPRELLAALETEGIVCDFREPDVIRVAPVPLYNTFEEVWSFTRVLERHV